MKIDNAAIIARIKQDPPRKTKFALRQGGEIVESVVDENNQLHYVIRKGSEITIEKASKSGYRVHFQIPQERRGESVTVQGVPSGKK